MFLTLQDTHSEPGDGGAEASGILAAFFYFFRDALGLNCSSYFSALNLIDHQVLALQSRSPGQMRWRELALSQAYPLAPRQEHLLQSEAPRLVHQCLRRAEQMQVETMLRLVML